MIFLRIYFKTIEQFIDLITCFYLQKKIEINLQFQMNLLLENGILLYMYQMKISKYEKAHVLNKIPLEKMSLTNQFSF